MTVQVNADVLLTIEQFMHHLGRAACDWNFREFCLAVWGATYTEGDSMYLYAQEKFHKLQDVGHFMTNNDSALLRKIIYSHLAEEARKDQ